MIRCLTGQEHDSQESLHLALQRAVHQTAKPLKERSRQQSKTETIEFRQALDRHMDYIHTHAEELWDQTKKSFSERNIALDLSDAFAGRAGQTDEDRKKASEKALANAANIVLADSEVETCVEGVHGGGRYVSRPRGSLFVRKELPEKLKPFAPQSQYTANPIRLLSNTL